MDGSGSDGGERQAGGGVRQSRRYRSAAERVRIVGETLKPGVLVQEVAHRHGVKPSVVYRWRVLHPGMSPDSSISLPRWRRPWRPEDSMRKPSSNVAPFDHIQAFLDGTRGQITIGEIPPLRRAVLAAEGKKVRVALVCRDDEPVSEFLERLDAALGKAVAENTIINEVLPEIQRRRSR
jgi:hypothetical protein